MIVEVLYFDGRPNYERLSLKIAALLKALEIDGEMRIERVESEEHAREIRFLGSPTVRVDGRDVEAGAEHRTDYGLKCRLCRTPAGLVGEPPDAWICCAIDVAPAIELASRVIGA